MRFCSIQSGRASEFDRGIRVGRQLDVTRQIGRRRGRRRRRRPASPAARSSATSTSVGGPAFTVTSRSSVMKSGDFEAERGRFRPSAPGTSEAPSRDVVPSRVTGPVMATCTPGRVFARPCRSPPASIAARAATGDAAGAASRSLRASARRGWRRGRRLHRLCGGGGCSDEASAARRLRLASPTCVRPSPWPPGPSSTRALIMASPWLCSVTALIVVRGALRPCRALTGSSASAHDVESMPSRVRVFAPASASNLGPGFDVLGLALGRPGDVVEAELADAPGVDIAEVTGDDGWLTQDPAQNVAGVAAQSVLSHLLSRARRSRPRRRPTARRAPPRAQADAAGQRSRKLCRQQRRRGAWP